MANKKNAIVAVSGGPDSMFLLNKLFKKNKYNLTVCHINYNKRESAIRDQKIVEDFVEQKNIRMETLFVDKEIEDKYKSYKNFQSKARKIRYDFFIKIAKEINSEIIFIGHHKDDFIETAIMQSARSDRYSYFGLKEKSYLDKIMIKRILLKLYKEEIISKMNKNNIIFGIDETNEDEVYERNKIRKNLNSLSLKEKNDIYKHYMMLNKSKELFNKRSQKYFEEWVQTEFEISYYKSTPKEYWEELIFAFLSTNLEDININSNKIRDINTFINKSTENKKYRIKDNLSICIKNKQLLIV